MAKKQVKGEAAFDAFVELIDPIFEVSQDPELTRLVQEEHVSTLQWLAAAVRLHKETFMRLLSLLTGEDASNMDFMAVYRGASTLMGNRDLMYLFLPRSQSKATSGSVSVNTEESSE